jgi:hypothetical protein
VSQCSPVRRSVCGDLVQRSFHSSYGDLKMKLFGSLSHPVVT